jgi:hypothetical protein
LPPFFAAFDANILSPWLIAHFARVDLVAPCNSATVKHDRRASVKDSDKALVKHIDTRAMNDIPTTSVKHAHTASVKHRRIKSMQVNSI